MKLSSTFLIAAAIAAIAGSAIAAPGPLHARALEQFNLFERDLDVESGVAELVERNEHAEPTNLHADHHADHRATIRALCQAKSYNYLAIRKSKAAHKVQETLASQERWQRIVDNHEENVPAINDMISSHREAARARHLHPNVAHDQARAEGIIDVAKSTIVCAIHDIKYPQ